MSRPVSADFLRLSALGVGTAAFGPALPPGNGSASDDENTIVYAVTFAHDAIRPIIDSPRRQHHGPAEGGQRRQDLLTNSVPAFNPAAPLRRGGRRRPRRRRADRRWLAGAADDALPRGPGTDLTPGTVGR